MTLSGVDPRTDEPLKTLKVLIPLLVDDPLRGSERAIFTRSLLKVLIPLLVDDPLRGVPFTTI